MKAVFDRKILNNTAEPNRLARILNALTKAMRDEAYIPKIIVVVLEDDIIRYLNFNDYGVTTLYGRVIEFMSSNVRNAVDKFKEQFLPTRAKRSQYPMIIWIMPTSHMHYRNNTLRRKFAHELEGQIVQHHAFCTDVLWNSQSPAVVNDITGKMIPAGIRRYWHAVDRVIKYANTYFFNADASDEEQGAQHPENLPCNRGNFTQVDTRRVEVNRIGGRLQQHGIKYSRPSSRYHGFNHTNRRTNDRHETTVNNNFLRRQNHKEENSTSSPLAEEL